LSSVLWVAGRVVQFAGKILQSSMARQVLQAADTYQKATGDAAMQIRERVGEAVGMGTRIVSSLEPPPLSQERSNKLRGVVSVL